MTDGYKVGYGCTPKETRFKKGQSGNPKGRRKGHRNARQTFNEIAGERITVRENGRPRTYSKLELVLRQLFHRALKQDLGAIRLIVSLSHVIHGENEAGGAAFTPADITELRELVRLIAAQQADPVGAEGDGLQNGSDP